MQGLFSMTRSSLPSLPSKGKCMLSGKFLDVMKEAIEKSVEVGAECGVTFCVDKRTGDMVATRIHVGTAVEVDIPRCPRGTRKIGSFHTHLGKEVTPSLNDVAGAIDRGEEFMCVGVENDVYKDLRGGQQGFKAGRILCIHFNRDHPEFMRWVRRLEDKMIDVAIAYERVMEKIYEENKVPDEEDAMRVEERLRDFDWVFWHDGLSSGVIGFCSPVEVDNETLVIYRDLKRERRLEG